MQKTPGVVDLVLDLAAGNEPNWRDCLISVSLSNKETFEFAEEVKIISAGKDDGQYMSRVQHTDWDEMFESRDLGIHLEALRNAWKEEFDFVLVDSRTGINNIVEFARFTFLICLYCFLLLMKQVFKE